MENYLSHLSVLSGGSRSGRDLPEMCVNLKTIESGDGEPSNRSREVVGEKTVNESRTWVSFHPQWMK